MKEIVKKSGGEAKLRLRGKGSGFVERDTGEESSEPLQLCISCPTSQGYDVARRCAEDLLLKVYDEYADFCTEQGREEAIPTIRMTEKHVDGGASGSGGGASSAGGGARRGGARGGKKKKPGSVAATPRAIEDHGEPHDDAPSHEDIEKMISERNACRKRGEYDKADEIRDDLKEQGVVLSDEKGAHGNGLTVTSWRYWKE